MKIEKGIDKIGIENLDYRLPIDDNNDEFTHISKKLNDMCDIMQTNVEKNYLAKIAQQDAEYISLQNTINPHFLYNTLEAVRLKLDKCGLKDGSSMIVLLSRFFEYQFRGKRFVTLEEEFDNLDIYIEFFSIRYDNAFTYIINVEEETLGYTVPKFILQPLVENYFVHGIKQDGNDVLKISCTKKDDIINIVIEDNGYGINEEKLKQIRHDLGQETTPKTSSVGLLNVNERLRLIYGKEHKLRVESKTGQGTKISLDLGAKYKEG